VSEQFLNGTSAQYLLISRIVSTHLQVTTGYANCWIGWIDWIGADSAH